MISIDLFFICFVTTCYLVVNILWGLLERSNSLLFLLLITELPIASPLVYAALRMTETWKDSVLESLMNFGQAPDSFIPGCFADSNATGPAITKYRCLFEPQNTPFKQTGMSFFSNEFTM